MFVSEAGKWLTQFTPDLNVIVWQQIATQPHHALVGAYGATLQGDLVSCKWEINVHGPSRAIETSPHSIGTFDLTLFAEPV